MSETRSAIAANSSTVGRSASSLQYERDWAAVAGMYSSRLLPPPGRQLQERRPVAGVGRRQSSGEVGPHPFVVERTDDCGQHVRPREPGFAGGGGQRRALDSLEGVTPADRSSRRYRRTPVPRSRRGRERGHADVGIGLDRRSADGEVCVGPQEHGPGRLGKPRSRSFNMVLRCQAGAGGSAEEDHRRGVCAAVEDGAVGGDGVVEAAGYGWAGARW